ncbi:MAG TPA: acyltransferase, partial [Chthoniobacterales bacterium]
VVIGADSRFTGAKANIMIEDDFLSASGLYINTGSHDLDTLQPTYLPVVIGRRVWCGMRVTICAGVSIGDNAVLGAGAVVLKNMPANHVAAGVPCKAIREIERPDRGADADWTNFKR